jgi:hypothetical protein
MTITEYNKNLENFRKSFKGFMMKKVAAYAGADIRAQIENRVEQTQTDAHGGKFSKYSTEPMLTSGNTTKSKRVWTELADSKKKRKELSWVTLKKGGKNVHLFELPGGYAELRRLEGFSNANKSFEFTGIMWDQFDIVDAQIKNDGFLIRMGGVTDYSQNLINIHSEKEGIAIIDMSLKEQQDINKRVDEWILEFAKMNKIA